MSKRNPPQPPRRVLGKEYRPKVYKPAFALGVFCLDETDQRRLWAKLSRSLAPRQVKVMVI